MTLETFFALTGLAFVSTWTPGPNNTMLAASGANFGLRRTLPHAAGVTLGFCVMIFAVALGLGELFRRAPVIEDVLRVAGAAFLLWIAWKIATAGGPGSAQAARPMGFWAAAGFQWINPKAWAMCLGVISQFAGGEGVTGRAFVIAAVFAAAGATSSVSWAGFGAAMQRVLSTPTRVRVFNVTMGILVASFVVVMLDDWL